MNKIGRMDEWVIDRVFQPVADRLSPWKSPDEIGRSCLIGSCVFVLGQAVFRWQQGTLPVALAVSAPAIIAYNLFWLRTIPPPSENSLPIARATMFLVRPFMLVMWLVFQPLIIALSLFQVRLGQDGFDLVTVSGMIESTLRVVAMYLMACKTRPPSRQTQTSPWKKVEAGA